MKKYILVALTLGLTSPSYGAGAAEGQITDPAKLASTVLRVQSRDGTLTGPIVTALEAIPANHRQRVALSVQDLLENQTEPQIGQFIRTLYDFYGHLGFKPGPIGAFHQIAKGLSGDNITMLIQFLQTTGGSAIEELARYIGEVHITPDLRIGLLLGLLTSEQTHWENTAREFILRNGLTAGADEAHGGAGGPAAAAHAPDEDDEILRQVLAMSLENVHGGVAVGDYEGGAAVGAPAVAAPAPTDAEDEEAILAAVLAASASAAPAPTDAEEEEAMLIAALGLSAENAQPQAAAATTVPLSTPPPATPDKEDATIPFAMAVSPPVAMAQAAPAPVAAAAGPVDPRAEERARRAAAAERRRQEAARAEATAKAPGSKLD